MALNRQAYDAWAHCFAVPDLVLGSCDQSTGETIAVNGIDFTVYRGEVFGFLGPNGAGKSTTVRMLTGFIRPTAGSITIAGHDLLKEATAVRRHLGVVPEKTNVYADLTVWQKRDADGCIARHVEGTGHPSRRRTAKAVRPRRPYLADRKQVSKGLRQRLMLCMALVSMELSEAPYVTRCSLDVYHHVANREQFLRKLRDYLKPGGRIAIIDFNQKSPMGPPPAERIPASQVKSDLEKAGYALSKEERFLPDQNYLVFKAAKG